MADMHCKRCMLAACPLLASSPDVVRTALLVLPVLQAKYRLICAHYLKKAEEYVTSHMEQLESINRWAGMRTMCLWYAVGTMHATHNACTCLQTGSLPFVHPSTPKRTVNKHTFIPVAPSGGGAASAPASGEGCACSCWSPLSPPSPC